MSDILSQIEEIQGNVRDIKATWGNTIMTLDNIKSSLKADRQKAIEEAYLQGKHDAEQDLARAAYEEAYQKGFEAGQHEATTLEYQQGLEEGKKQAKAQAHLDVCHDIERVAHGNYQKGLDDAWEAARKICNEPENGGLPAGAVVELFGRNGPILGCSAQNAINKIKAYEEQQKADKIAVGDEVDYKGVTKYVVTGIVDDDTICGFTLNGLWNANTIKEVTKTGRHFPQVAELLKAMKEGAE